MHHDVMVQMIISFFNNIASALDTQPACTSVLNSIIHVWLHEKPRAII